MKYLAIDFGLRHLGLATNYGSLAEPLGEITYYSQQEAISEIKNLCQKQKVDQIVVGLSENQMGLKTKEFGETITKNLNLPVIFHDETLTSKEAREKLQTAGLRGKKRAKREHQAAAALILQSFLDSLRENLVE